MPARYIRTVAADVEIAQGPASTESGGFLDRVVDTKTGTTIFGLTTTGSAVGPFINVKDFGARGDNATDDTVAIQAAVNACPAGGTVFFPYGTYVISTAINVPTAMTLQGMGSPYVNYIVAVGCGGLVISNGANSVSNVIVRSLGIVAKVRYSTTVNTYVGIQVLGVTGSRPFNHCYEDVYVDGFQTAFQSGYLWSAKFDTFKCNYGLIGLDIYGLSVNNFVGNCALTVAGGVGSRGIRFAGQESVTNAAAVASEGWTIGDSLIYSAEVGVEIISNAHIVIHDCILDFCTLNGVSMKDNGTNFSGNNDIHDNYIAMTGAGGNAAIVVNNTIVNTTNTLNRIHDNHAVLYPAGTCSYGIYIQGTNSTSSMRGNVLGNASTGFSQADIRTMILGNIITENVCLSPSPALTANIYSDFLNQVANNIGVVYTPGGTTPRVYTTNGRMNHTYTDTLPPTTGTWNVGDVCDNRVAAVGSPKRWLCTVAGTPGTWVSEGIL